MWQNQWALFQSFQSYCCFFVILLLLWLSLFFCVGQKMSFIFKFYAWGPTAGNCAFLSVFYYMWCLCSIILNTKMLLICYTFLWNLMQIQHIMESLMVWNWLYVYSLYVVVYSHNFTVLHDFVCHQVLPYFSDHKTHPDFFVRHFRKKYWWMYFNFSNLLEENRIGTYQN